MTRYWTKYAGHTEAAIMQTNQKLQQIILN